ncbi:hypothetical protein L914_12547 [Phytophthora nicotianae]|uniref:Kazal-like domain-containing protein n=2 Tax=Phytophthora nicotianae TaxID=4792 RepID=V9ER66_PHYNI|nr:hypothetical protein F443_13024 [Phytophthora nicotianae P1569]ETM41696.1 hypothetical protein L914_12547 [Phytophthora nicotianae]
MKFAIATLISAAAILGMTEAADYITVDPATLTKVNPENQLPGPVTSTSTANPALFMGIGPEIFPGEPGYKDPFASSVSGSASGSVGSLATSCSPTCPNDKDPVCGTDGVTYDNSCKLGLAACLNPLKGIAKKSDGPCK